MIDLSPYHSFKSPVKASSVLLIRQRSDLKKLEINSSDHFIVLGKGCNVLFLDDYYGKVLINQIESLSIKEFDHFVLIRAGAGLDWHDFVCNMSGKGYYGLENLAYIPGTVGASPVQNIGAYGVEVSEFIEQIIVYDLKLNKVITLAASDCCFCYRDSAFKSLAWRQRYIIIEVVFRLSKQFTPNLSYTPLAHYFTSVSCSPDSLLNAVIQIRKSKLPNPCEIPNAGSFFKNPIILKNHFKKLKLKYSDIKCYELEDDLVKVPAAWLIEKAGFKGKTLKNGVGTYEKHALILVNRAGARGNELYQFACDMMHEVNSRFGILLEPEVRIIGDTSDD